jgi:hypothetical protein
MTPPVTLDASASIPRFANPRITRNSEANSCRQQYVLNVAFVLDAFFKHAALIGSGSISHTHDAQL